MAGMPWAVIILMGGAGMAPGGSPPAPAACAPSGTPAVGSATFTIVDGTGSREMEFGEGDLVFCRTTSPTMVWIRFAGSRENDGNDVPHLDIDVCHLGHGGVFTPMEARAQPCPGGPTWGIWWHEGPALAYANRGNSSPCELRLEVEEARLVGTFSCHGLVTEDGASTIDIVDGRFTCDLVGSEGAERH